MVVATGIDVLEILIIGLSATGKSSFVETICDHYGKGSGNLAGWRLGELSVEDTLNVRFLEPPQMTVFDFMWMRNLIDRADVPGFVVVCDSTRAKGFGETVGLLETIRAFHPHTPCVLVANKQDKPGAWSAEDLRIGLGIPDDILVVPCVAHDRESVKEVVLQLLYKIME